MSSCASHCEHAFCQWLHKSRERLAAVTAGFMMIDLIASICLGTLLMWLLPVEIGWIALGFCLFLGWVGSQMLEYWHDQHIARCVDLKAPRASSR